MFVHTPVLWIQTNHILNAPTVSVGLGPAGGGADHHVRRGGAATDRWELWKRSPREGEGSEMMNCFAWEHPEGTKYFCLCFFCVWFVYANFETDSSPGSRGGVECTEPQK